jgi:hypothetical protein
MRMTDEVHVPQRLYRMVPALCLGGGACMVADGMVMTGSLTIAYVCYVIGARIAGKGRSARL